MMHPALLVTFDMKVLLPAPVIPITKITIGGPCDGTLVDGAGSGWTLVDGAESGWILVDEVDAWFNVDSEVIPEMEVCFSDGSSPDSPVWTGKFGPSGWAREFGTPSLVREFGPPSWAGEFGPPSWVGEFGPPREFGAPR